MGEGMWGCSSDMEKRIYVIRASEKKLKYYEQQVKFTAEYNWRKLVNEVWEQKPSLGSLPEDLVFETDQVNFEDLNTFSWLKSDFCLPILHIDFISFLTSQAVGQYRVFPIEIVDSSSREKINQNFALFYLIDSFNCIDVNTSQAWIGEGETAQYDYRTAIFKKDISYPIIFKVASLSQKLKHFVDDVGKEKIESLGLVGFDIDEATYLD